MKEQNQRQIQNQTELDERRLRQKKLVRKRKIVLSVMLLTSFLLGCVCGRYFPEIELGKTEEDTYVTHVDQVKQDKDITITLKDAIASDQQLRCSVLVTNKDKTKTKLKDVQMEDMKINDQEPEENRGYAVLGKENVKKGTIHFLSVNYQRQDIPLNPKISLKVRVKSKLYHLSLIHI